MFDYERTDDRLTLRRPETRWLSNGFDGGYATAAAAHNLTVPEGFDRTDLAAYATERLGAAPAGPTLLTGVRQEHARGARYGPIEAVVTAGLSNPAVLPIEEPPVDGEGTSMRTERGTADPGTVNVFLGSETPLTDGGLAGLLATAVEAKTATLAAVAGCTGTTSDAVVVGCPVTDGGAQFAGSATAVGNAARVCVRDAIRSALSARYEEAVPDPERTDHGTVTSGTAGRFRP
jgi:adenosylcobinamide hydrolase